MIDALLRSPVTTAGEAVAYLRSLLAAGYGYNPDDDAEDIVRVGSDGPLFTPEQAGLANVRMGEVFAHLADPCGVMLDLLDAS